MGLVIDMVVSIFLLIGATLAEQIFDRCLCICILTMALEIGVYVVTWFTVNPGQD